jgi:hypothetical protein
MQGGTRGPVPTVIWSGSAGRLYSGGRVALEIRRPGAPPALPTANDTLPWMPRTHGRWVRVPGHIAGFVTVLRCGEGSYLDKDR